MTEATLAPLFPGATYALVIFLIALTLTLGFVGYAYATKSKIINRIKREPDLHLEADPLMDAPLKETSVSGVSETLAVDSVQSLHFQPYPKAAELLRAHGITAQVVIESGHISGPVYFSDLEASVQAEIFNLESKKNIFGNHWMPFLYQSSELPPRANLVFIYSHPIGQPGALRGYCFIG